MIKECVKYKIDFLTTPYDLDYVDNVNRYVEAYKIGSGDITWIDIIKKIAKKNKPIFLATGACEMKDVESMMEELEISPDAKINLEQFRALIDLNHKQ